MIERDKFDEMFEAMIEAMTYEELCELIAETDNYNGEDEA